MNKDIIYIDVEDDITAIITKVKASKEKVIALVPPKRVGVLQSAVNLRLLERAAKQADKHLALVTSNQSLIALASAATIPVAKNLQSKPELAEVDPVIDDDEDDIIEGAALPIGDHARQTPGDAKDTRDAAMAAALAEAPKGNASPKKPKKSKSASVPNFNTFRKRLILIIIAAILLIGFLVWAIFFAPRATVVISAKTTSSSINLPVTVSSDAETSSSKSTLQAIAQEQESDKSEKVAATGKKDVGSKATGTVTFSTSSLGGLGTIPAGTKLETSSGLTFTTDSSVTLGYQGGTSSSDSTGVTAAENGSKYNAATGKMDGAPNQVTATLDDPTSGGVTKMVKIITANDVQKAKQSLVDGDTDDIKADLKKKFNDSTVVIDQSFDVDYSDVQVSPAVGEEADEATLTTTITYRLYGVQRSELSKFLDAYLKEDIKNSSSQRVYENGSEEALFQEASSTKDGAKATLIATAQIGPRIDDKEVKELSKGKRYGEIQQALETIQGVDSVDVKFFPFWVSTVPNNDERITIDFKLEKQ